MNVLILGSGAREHALASVLARSLKVEKIYVAPGNAGTRHEFKNKVFNVPKFDETKILEIFDFAREFNIGLVIPGSEASLVAGITDELKKMGIPCFGPSMAAAALEGSKAFSKNFMKQNGILTSDFQVFTEFQPAVEYVKSRSNRVVIKASGLAMGKGVIIPSCVDEAVTALKSMLVENAFGDAGKEVVIEDFIQGEEVSVLAFTDGHSVAMMPPAQDHKRVFDNDMGPNTGGMGAYCPACPRAVAAKKSEFFDGLKKNVLERAVNGLRRAGTPYVGVIYAGILVSDVDAKPYVLEFNARFGDPEAQVILTLLKSDLLEIMLACINGHLDSLEVKFDDTLSACTVVLASAGYPGKNTKLGVKFPLVLEKPVPKKVMCFVAGVQESLSGPEDIITTGGRVASITGIGSSLAEAVKVVYENIPHFQFEGMHYRSDIARRALICDQNTVASVGSEQAGDAMYDAAGVSIDRGNELVNQIASVTEKTKRPGADAIIGGFGAMFDIAAAGYGTPSADKQNDTILVASTDGVGTKLRIAIDTGNYGGIGQDLVAMSVNDIVVQGAEPLFFLDYFACGKLDPVVAGKVVQSIACACKEAGCALIGGETAEMPGMYANADIDVAGFAVGAVLRKNILPHLNQISEGNLVLGIPSSGVHSNGFSLVREVFRRAHAAGKLQNNAPSKGSDSSIWSYTPPFSSELPTLGDACLTPTRLYVRDVLKLVNEPGTLLAAAHITGGGLLENIPRVLPANLGVRLDAKKWTLHPIFTWMMSNGPVPKKEMLRTFNCGVGMVLIVPATALHRVKTMIPDVQEIGVVVGTFTEQVIVDNF